MDGIEATSAEVEADGSESQGRHFERVIEEAMRAAREGKIPSDLLLKLAQAGSGTLQFCIRRMADPNLSKSEETTLSCLIQKAGLTPKLVEALFSIDRQSATAIAVVLQRMERGLDLRLAVHLQSESPGIVMRSLELLDAIVKSKQLAPVLFGCLSHDDRKIKSKAALVIQKFDREFLYTRKLLHHSDARVRANALESLIEHAGEKTLEFLRQGAVDPDHRVRSVAAVGLCRVADPLGRQTLDRMIQSSNAAERRSAAWALAESSTPESLAQLESLALADPDERVRELATAGFRNIKDREAGQVTKEGGAPNE